MPQSVKGWIKKQNKKKENVKRETCVGAMDTICNYCVHKGCPFSEGHTVVRCGAFIRKKG